MMTIARDIEFEESRAPVGTGAPAMTTGEVLQKAYAMAMEIEKLLTSSSCRIPSADIFRVRLARAHALSLLDQLSELVARQPDHDVGIARSRSGDDEANTISAVHSAKSLRQ